MELETKISIVFKNEKGDTKELETSFAELLEKDSSDYYDELETYDNCSCYTESQNFCECSPQFEDFEIKGFVINQQ